MKKSYYFIIVILIALIIFVWKADFFDGRIILPSYKSVAEDTFYYNVHTEKPVESWETGTGIGYSYEVTQIFFEIEKDDTIKQQIIQCMDECGVIYENLYYTSEGYYTADLVGYKHVGTKTEYENVANSISGPIVAWIEGHPDIMLAQRQSTVYISGRYKSIK